MREFLEKNYTDEAIETDDLTIKLVIRALLEVSPPVKPGLGSVGGTELGSKDEAARASLLRRLGS